MNATLNRTAIGGTPSELAADPYRLLVEAAAEHGLFLLDPMGVVTTWNPGAEKITGYSAEEIIGQPVAVLSAGEDAMPRLDRSLRIALTQGRFADEGWRVRKDGTSFWATVTITPLRDSDDSHLGFATVLHDATARKQAEERRCWRERALDSFMQGVSVTDPTLPDNPIIYANESFLRLTGYGRDEIIGKNCRFLQGPQTSRETVDQIRTAIRTQKACLVELLNYRKDGTPFWNALSISPLHDSTGQVTHFVGVQTDISPFKLLEKQFHQVQKMQAVGQLAGGVAHDFNNLLTIISGYSELLLQMLPAQDRRWEAVKAISEAGERAAGLTRQLLSFSRQAVLETKVVDLNDIVKDTEKMLRHVIGEDIALTAVLDPAVSRIKGDPGQMGQVLLNLAVNVRDAMPKGGNLTIETCDVELDETYTSQHAECKPGRYVRLAVSDTGHGMTPEAKAHVFEPFFTTKGPGKGTGLGLATVYGIVKQSGGSIEVYSEVDHGTTFKIYLPAIHDPLHSFANDDSAVTVPGGTETILLVEDEEAVRAIALLALQTQGYTVLPAESGKKALALVEKLRPKLDILVTDVVMPGMSGRELAETLSAKQRDLKVLFLSGYTDDSVIRHGILQADVAFLQKPYTPLSLARKVREVLDKKVATLVTTPKC